MGGVAELKTPTSQWKEGKNRRPECVVKTNFLVEPQRWRWSVVITPTYISESVSLSHTPPPAQGPNTPASKLSGLLYCLQYFKFPLKCLVWQVVRPFPLQLQACWVSQMGLLKKQHSFPKLTGGGDGDIWPAVNPTGWAQAPSDAFGDEKVPKTCGSGERDAHTHFFSGFGLQFYLLLWNMSTTFSSVLKLKQKFQFLLDFFLLPLIQTSTHWHYKRIITGSS